MTESDASDGDHTDGDAPGLGAEGYRRFYHQSPVPTLTVDLNLREILDCNAAALDFLDLPRDQVIGRPGADFLAEPTPDQALRIRGLRGESTRAIRNVDTGRGVRITEVHIVPSGIEGVVFVQTHDLTDVLEANAVLERRTAELQDKTTELETLAARIAHDLRGPLATIGGFVDLLRTSPEDFPEPKRTDILERVSVNVRTLAKMISDMLDEATLSDSDVDSSAKVDDLFTELRSIFDVDLFAAGAVLETRRSIEELPVPVAGVRQAVVNLVSNSIKFRRADHPLVVSVDVTARPDAASITVSDNGPGLGPDPESLFADGVRGASSHGTDGTGLGLTFARLAIESLGGTLTAKPAEVGARFEIRLPREADQHDEAPVGFGGTYAGGLTARQLDRILAVAPTPTLLIDLSARGIVRVNAAAERLLGLRASEILGRRGSDFLVEPSEGDELRSAVLIRGSDQAKTTTFVRTSSGDIRVEVAMAAVPDTTLSIVQLHPLTDLPDARKP